MIFIISQFAPLLLTGCKSNWHASVPTADKDETPQSNQCETNAAPRFKRLADVGDWSNQPSESHVENYTEYFDITLGTGVIVEDFNGDGLLDVYLTRLNGDLVYLNLGERQFVLDSEWSPPQLESAKSVGGSAADFDGDGDFDVFVATAFGRNRLLMNTGNGFSDISEEMGIHGGEGDSTAAVWFDYDLDGDLDLFVAGHKEDPFAVDSEWPLATPNRLYENLGTIFEEAELLYEPKEAFTYAATWIQKQPGEIPWLYNVNDFGYEVIPNRLYEQTDGQFRVLGGTGLDLPMYGMGIAQADVNNDGRPDMLLSDFEGVSLMLSDASGYWYDSAYALGLTAHVEKQRFSWGVNLFDFENDGLVDAFAGWGPISNHGEGLAPDDNLNQPHSFWLNTGDRFKEMANAWGIEETLISRGSVVADLDQDGIQDLIVSNINGPAEIWWGRCMNGNWLGLRLQQEGMNRYAVGAKVTVQNGQKEQTKWIVAGDSFASGGPASVHFGLGQSTAEEYNVKIVLPNGNQHEEWLPVNTRSVVTLPSDMAD